MLLKKINQNALRRMIATVPHDSRLRRHCETLKLAFHSTRVSRKHKKALAWQVLFYTAGNFLPVIIANLLVYRWCSLRNSNCGQFLS